MLDEARLCRALPLIGYEQVGSSNGIVWFAPNDRDASNYEVVAFDLSQGGVTVRDFTRQLLDAGVSPDQIRIALRED